MKNNFFFKSEGSRQTNTNFKGKKQLNYISSLTLRVKEGQFIQVSESLARYHSKVRP